MKTLKAGPRNEKYLFCNHALVCSVCSPGLWADQADVIDGNVRLSAAQTYAFDVTVRQADTGWDHYLILVR